MCHILVIEDEFLIALDLSDMVERAGATSVAIAASEAEAVKLANSQPPAIIVSDVNLGHGGNGPKAVQAIRDALGEVPTIFVTATPEACSPCDYASAIMRKPVHEASLVAEIAKVRPAAT